MIDFSSTPYFDDFSPNKHFHRILFKPGRAIQARELTQLQSILQSQISSFADHIFSQNTPVKGGNVTVDKNRYYLQISTEIEDQAIDVNNFLNRILINQTGTIQARVIGVADAVYDADNNLTEYPILVVSFLTGIKFKHSDKIYAADDSGFTANIISKSHHGKPPIGKASTAHISDGIFYVINGYSYDSVQNPDGTYTKYSLGNFVTVQSQSIIIDKWSDTPSCRIGLDITETIYDYIDDFSLLDPALGSSNFQAPGADRYVIELELVRKDLTPGNDDAFIELVRIEKGEIKKQVDSTVYSTIDEYFAKRTAETNGDYIVENFKLNLKPDVSPDGKVSNANNFIEIGRAHV